MRQWVLRITEYADRLLEDLDLLDWPENLKEMQRNWIGKSDGAMIAFKVAGSNKQFEVFTTRPDTIYDATYVVLAPEHPFVNEITTADEKDAVNTYVEQTKQKSDLERMTDKEKTGVFTGAYAVNPINNKEVPIWIADYVLPHYGTGAVMAVPAHDTRDFDFAQTYGLEIIEVVKPLNANSTREDDGVLINSGIINGLNTKDAIKKINEYLVENKI